MADPDEVTVAGSVAGTAGVGVVVASVVIAHGLHGRAALGPDKQSVQTNSGSRQTTVEPEVGPGRSGATPLAAQLRRTAITIVFDVARSDRRYEPSTTPGFSIGSSGVVVGTSVGTRSRHCRER